MNETEHKIDGKKANRNRGILTVIAGFILMYIMIQNGGGFNRGIGAESSGANMSSLIFWILSIYLIISGIIRIRKEYKSNKKQEKILEEIKPNRHNNKPSNKLIIAILLFFALVFGIYFYWHSIRPSEIKSFCNHQAMENTKNTWKKDRDKEYEFLYQECLRSKGL